MLAALGLPAAQPRDRARMLAGPRLRGLVQLQDRRQQRPHDARPGGSVRGERANFTRLVLGCIEAKFCK